MNLGPLGQENKTASSYIPGSYSATTDYIYLSGCQTDTWRETHSLEQPDNLLMGNVLVEVLSSQFLGASLNYSFEEEEKVAAEGFTYSSERAPSLALVQMLEGITMPRDDTRIPDSDCVRKPALQKQKCQQKLLNFQADAEQVVIAADLHRRLRQQSDTTLQTLSAHSVAKDCTSCQRCPSSQCSDQLYKALVGTTEEESRLMTSSPCTIEEVTSSQGPNSSTSGNLSENLLDVQRTSSGHFPSFADHTTDHTRSGMNTITDRKKRKRTRACKNSQEVESQRMTHITVERNRRKQMNEHLGVLRSLMPGSYIQRGDQASIIGGAIEFVKELEEVLQSLQAQKRKRDCEDGSFSPHAAGSLITDFILSPQFSFNTSASNTKYENDNIFQTCRDLVSESNSPVADVEVKMVGQEAVVKVLSRKRHGQLLKAISAMESVHLTIMHLNITTIEQTVLYSFNVKMGVECQLQTGSELAIAIQQIFSFIHANSMDKGQ